LEILVILAVVIIIFGVGKLPRVGGALGNSIREFRGASRGDDEAAPAINEGKTSTPTVSARDAYCTQCGVAVAPELRFCTACGTSVTRVTGS